MLPSRDSEFFFVPTKCRDLLFLPSRMYVKECSYYASLPSEPSTFTILWMYIFFMFSRAGFKY